MVGSHALTSASYLFGSIGASRSLGPSLDPSNPTVMLPLGAHVRRVRARVLM